MRSFVYTFHPCYESARRVWLLSLSAYKQLHKRFLCGRICTGTRYISDCFVRGFPPFLKAYRLLLVSNIIIKIFQGFCVCRTGHCFLNSLISRIRFHAAFPSAWCMLFSPLKLSFQSMKRTS